jgi:hypothetical protein
MPQESPIIYVSNWAAYPTYAYLSTNTSVFIGANFTKYGILSPSINIYTNFLRLAQNSATTSGCLNLPGNNSDNNKYILAYCYLTFFNKIC